MLATLFAVGALVNAPNLLPKAVQEQLFQLRIAEYKARIEKEFAAMEESDKYLKTLLRELERVQERKKP